MIELVSLSPELEALFATAPRASVTTLGADVLVGHLESFFAGAPRVQVSVASGNEARAVLRLPIAYCLFFERHTEDSPARALVLEFGRDVQRVTGLFLEPSDCQRVVDEHERFRRLFDDHGLSPNDIEEQIVEQLRRRAREGRGVFITAKIFEFETE